MTKEERLEYLKNWKKQQNPEEIIEQDNVTYSDDDYSEDSGYSQGYIQDINSYFKGDY
jgi:hypothetical protein